MKLVERSTQVGLEIHLYKKWGGGGGILNKYNFSWINTSHLDQ